MPYIAVQTTQELTEHQKQTLVEQFGRLITLIPGKTEKALMIDFFPKHTMYLAGKPLENGAFLDVRIYGTADFVSKQAFTQAVFQMMEAELGIEANALYVNFSEHAHWGAKGTFK